MKVTAEPIIHRDEYSSVVEREINAYFDEVIFAPLRLMLKDAGVRQNAVNVSALWNALMNGTVWYAADTFTGSFTAEISRELRAIGARKTLAGFVLPSRELPMQLRGVVAQSQAKSKALHLAILAFLLTAETNIPKSDTGLVLRPAVETITADLHRQLVRTISATDAPVTIPLNPPDLVREATEKLRDATEQEIKKFGLEEVQRVREKVQQNLSEGGRTDRLEQLVESQLGVTQRKANIVAQAETSKLVSDYRKNRYMALGSKEYIWDTSHDEKVRPTHGESNNHRILDGRKFSWAVAPVVDAATGRRRHPGEDFGPCRCVARPLFVFA